MLSSKGHKKNIPLTFFNENIKDIKKTYVKTSLNETTKQWHAIVSHQR